MLTVAKWTIDDYHHIRAAGVLDQRHVELIGGEIVEMSPEGEPHAYSSDEAGEYLVYLLGDRAKVRHAKPITLLDRDSEPEPDIAIVQRLGRDYRQHHPYPENVFWVMEYADSSLDKDLGVKTQLYAKADIPEYWIVNLKTLELIVLRSPTATGYQASTTFTQGTIAPLAFPDIAIKVKRLLNP